MQHALALVGVWARQRRAGRRTRDVEAREREGEQGHEGERCEAKRERDRVGLGHDRVVDHAGPALHGICYNARVSTEDPYVCLCLAVRESEIKAAIAGGADSVARIGGMCEAGSACQSCHPQLRELLREHAAAQLARSQAPKSLHQLSLFDELQGARRPSTPAGSHVGRSKPE